MAEHSSGRLSCAALCWLQVVTALPAGDRGGTRRRHQHHQGGEGQKKDDTQHSCAYSTSRGNYQTIEEASNWVWIQVTEQLISLDSL